MICVQKLPLGRLFCAACVFLEVHVHLRAVLSLGGHVGVRYHALCALQAIRHLLTFCLGRSSPHIALPALLRSMCCIDFFSHPVMLSVAFERLNILLLNIDIVGLSGVACRNLDLKLVQVVDVGAPILVMQLVLA